MNPTTVPTAAPKRPRDLRLDFFRGLGMYIIFMAHVPMNEWNRWIPARFGFSDATEIFVFCSGMASAIAFGAVFRERSWWLGTARCAYRVWQVYWAHIALFMVTLACLIFFEHLRGEMYYTERLYVRPFLDDTANHVLGLMTLSYVPNYFDILPMYLVILAMMPVIVGIGLVNRWAAFALVIAIWLLAQADILQFSAEVRDLDREWFFNPFGWQLIFFTGFAFMIGWLKPPPLKLWLALIAAGILLMSLVVGSRFGYENSQWVLDWRLANRFWFEKTDLGILRVLHFLSLAYFAYYLAGEGGRRLVGTGLWAAFVEVVRKVGQQSLAIFLTGMVLAQVVGAALDLTDRNTLIVAVANLTGVVILTITAYVTGWFKSQPWRRPPSASRPAPADPPMAREPAGA